jgi:hypothetical protein
MIISHKYKFVFVKTIKTAGTSMEVYLSQHCGPRDIFTPITPPVPGHKARNFNGRVSPSTLGGETEVKQIFFNHMTARKIKQTISAKHWDSYFKFCVERNPWDRTLSHYHMFCHRHGHQDLQAYLESGNAMGNLFRYVDSDKQLLVDRVLRYERLNNELAEIFGQLGVPFSGSLDVYAKSDYRTDRRHYREVYTAQQRDMVYEQFADEIEMFGYVY